MFACGFWLVAFLCDWQYANRARWMLTFFMFIATLHFLGQAIFCYGDYRLTALYDPVYTLCTGLVFPVFYLYIVALTDRGGIRWRTFLVVVPSIVLCLCSAAGTLLIAEDEMIEYCRQVHYWKEPLAPLGFYGTMLKWTVKVLAVVFALQIPFVGWFGALRIRAYNRLVAEYYSNQEHRSLEPVKGLYFFFIFTSVFSAGFNALGRTLFITSNGILAVASVLFVLMLFALGYVGFKQYFFIQDYIKDTAKAHLLEEKVTEESPGDAVLSDLKSRLIALMTEKHLYRETDLRLNEVAALLGSNQTYLSLILNKQMHTTFADFVNAYRVEHAKELIRNRASLSLTIGEVAEESGFSSESSFYRVFKKATGSTPKSWMKH